MGVDILSFGFCLLAVAVAAGDNDRQTASSLPLCRADEEFQKCGCLRTCCNGGQPQGCLAQCSAGCFCKDGLVRNKNGDCIPLKDCKENTEPPPPSCGPDEENYPCIPTCRNTCENYNATNPICSRLCRPGCFCKQGWVKRSDGKCVPKSQCNVPPTDKPPVCGDDEEFYDDCAPSCTGTCKAYNSKGIYHCPLCRPGCWCKRGKVKDYDGKCVTPSECDTTNGSCPVNEVQTKCVSKCNDCKIKGQCQSQGCTPGCDCKAGYYRNDQEKCIPEAQCPQKGVCGPGEEYQECGTFCPRTCANRRYEIRCIAKCVDGCFCKEGLIRNDDNVCVDPDQCPNECGKNEEFSYCGSACPDTCANLGKPQVCTEQCVKGCFCKKGYVRNSDDECVPKSSCQKCGENEVYDSCGSACPKTCKNKDKNILCTLQCVPGCFCLEGLVRDSQGKCIDPRRCENSKPPPTKSTPIITRLPRSPNRCGLDEVYQECGTACPRTCESLYTKIRCIERCVPGCFCKGDLVRDSNGKCIDIGDCQTQRCNPDEEYKKCGTACPPTCTNGGKPQACTDQCVSGCYCKSGLVRNNQGECVPLSQCPSRLCDADEEYKKCGPACIKTCKNLNIKIACIDLCVEGCFCKDGMVRNDEGKCVDPNQCPNQECTGYNEALVDCAKPAWCNTCGIRGNCKLTNCNKGCDCKPNYYRNATGLCVPEAECIECNGYNEALVDCAKPKSCNTCEIRGNCKLKKCDKGCDCKPGFYRNATEICIPENQCPGVSNGSDCDKAPETGRCKARMPRFYYDQASGSCKNFIYGGCGGNKNNFMSVEECMKQCGIPQ